MKPPPSEPARSYSQLCQVCSGIPFFSPLIFHTGSVNCTKLSRCLWDTNKFIREYCASRISPYRLLLIMRVNNSSVWSTNVLDVQYDRSFLFCLPKRPSIGRSMADVNALKYWWPLLAICLSLSILSARKPNINSVGCRFPAQKKKNLLHPSANQTSSRFLDRQRGFMPDAAVFTFRSKTRSQTGRAPQKSPTGTQCPIQHSSDQIWCFTLTTSGFCIFEGWYWRGNVSWFICLI